MSHCFNAVVSTHEAQELAKCSINYMNSNDFKPGNI